LNSKVSNSAWLGENGKMKALEAHDVLLLNREIVKAGADEWSDANIRNRTRRIADAIVKIWPVPDGYRSGFVPDRPRARRKIRLSDLVSAGCVQPGTMLHARSKNLAHRYGIVLPDGQVEVDGKAYAGPSEAATAIKGQRVNGWWFLLVDPSSRRALRDIRNDYVNEMALDAVDDDDDDGEDDV
jgi:hypothetical protein